MRTEKGVLVRDAHAPLDFVYCGICDAFHHAYWHRAGFRDKVRKDAESSGDDAPLAQLVAYAKAPK